MGNILEKFKSWFRLGEVDPVADEKLIWKIILMTERGAIAVVALVSGIAVAAYGYLLASGYTSIEPIRWVSAATLFILATAITDVGVKYFIQKGAYDLFAAFNPATYKNSSFNWFQRAMQVIGWLVMVGLIWGMFYFDYISTDSVRRPVANMVKKESKLNQDSIRQIVLAQENARVGAVVEAINAINADIRTTQRQIDRAKEQAGAANMKRLAASGNGWAKQQIKIAQIKAAAPYQDQLKQQLQTKQQLTDQRAKDLAYQSAMVARSDSSVLATNAGIEGRNESLVSGTSTMFIWLGFWAKCIAGGLRVLLVVLFLAGNPKDFNGDGKTDFRDVTPAAKQGFLTV